MNTTLSTEQLQVITDEAITDAANFYAEFGTAIDPSQTDWDGTAWEMADCRVDLTGEQLTAGWLVYQRALVAETQRLAHTPTTTTIETITDEQIDRLHTEAGNAGDDRMVRICESALDGDQAARDECARVIDAAAAMD